MTDSHQTVFLNTAAADDIAGIAGLGNETAARLVAARPFHHWSDLKRVEGLDDDRIAELRGQGAELGDPATGPIGEPGSGGSAGSPAGNLGRA